MRLGLLVLFCILSAACNGRDARSPLNSADLPGIWEANFNLTLDECAVLSEGIFSFSDVLTITQQDQQFLVDAESGLFESSSGVLRDDSSLLIEDLFEGDLFGDGIFCSYRNSVSFVNLQNNSSDALFTQRLSCADGYLCESHGVGQAIRR